MHSFIKAAIRHQFSLLLQRHSERVSQKSLTFVASVFDHILDTCTLHMSPVETGNALGSFFSRQTVNPILLTNDTLINTSLDRTGIGVWFPSSG